jgi:hypothetical protein
LYQKHCPFLPIGDPYACGARRRLAPQLILLRGVLWRSSGYTIRSAWRHLLPIANMAWTFTVLSL